MNDEKSAEQPDSSELPKGKNELTDKQASAPEPDEVKKLQESFGRIYNGPNKLRHEYDLRLEAKQLGMEFEEYRCWYELSSESSNWWPRFWRWTGFGEKKLWDVLQLAASVAVPIVLATGTYYLQENAKQREQATQELAKQREQAAAFEKVNQDTLVKYLDQMAELLQKGLLKTKLNSETFIIAQAKTVIALQSLDPKRQHLVIQFLDAANLNSLDGKKGILHQARMSKANLIKADLSFAKLSFAKLSGANLFSADLSGAILNGADLIYADLSGANLSKANISGTILFETNLKGSDLNNADLSHANLKGSDLDNADLSMANLSKANISGVNLSGANLSGANLIKADLYSAALIGADLREADLTKANLIGASFNNANLKDATLIGAKFNGPKVSWNPDIANLYDAETLSKIALQAGLFGAKLCNTTLPDGTVSNRDCGK
jgi:uncharacterized protein YjbI with pentapeptide repeats